ncbi:hypothetical protein KEM54_006095 [Ascosphaera aggregata]|nr:hypothetical protein KEM54_006095 [Ascosphaera aggregata]
MSCLDGNHIEPIEPLRTADAAATHEFRATKESTATSPPSQWWQQIHMQCKEQLEKTESTIRRLGAIYTTESIRDQQARRTIAVMLDRVSSVRDYLLQLRSGERRSSQLNDEGLLGSRSTDQFSGQKDMTGNGSAGNGNASAASKHSAPYKPLKRLRIDEAESTNPGATTATRDGNEQPVKRARLAERHLNDASKSISGDQMCETEDNSEEVGRRLLERQERRRKRWAGRETKRKREVDDIDQVEMVPRTEHILKRLRTADMTSREPAYTAKRRTSVSEGHHKSKKRLT